MSDPLLSRRLARHARVGAAERLPRPLEGWMRLLLLDHLAVTAAARRLGSTVAARASVTTAPVRSSDRPAGLVGGGFAAVADAAFVNGVAAHGLDLDDTYEAASLHAGTVVFPAALSVAEAEGRSTAQLLAASAVGYDVTCALGVLLGAKESYARGFHPTAVAGAVGAAAAVAVLLGLDEDQTVHALGLAATTAAGSLEFLSDGSWTKRLNAGHAAASAVRAGQLAKAGFTAPATALEGRDGFLRLYGDGLVPGRTLELGALGQGALDTSVKFYPCCRYLHGAIDLLRQVHDERPGLAVDDVDVVEVAVIRAGAGLVADPPARKLVVETTVDAQFSMPFGAAVALATGTATVAQFADAPAVARTLAPWMAKVRCVTSPRLEAAFPESWQAEVVVRLQDGSTVARSEEAFQGSPGCRATLGQVQDKASGLVGATEADRLSRHVLRSDGDQPWSGLQ